MTVSAFQSGASDLPVLLTPLVGRKQEIEAIQKLLTRNEVNLLTLTGPAGVGKTRLANAVAESVASQFDLGVVFVDLSPATSATNVMPVIGQALGLTESPALTAEELVAVHLTEQPRLLVLDNFEQVIEAGPQLNAILATVPNVKVLVTSRIALRVQGEQEYTVPSLSVPSRMELSDRTSIDLDTV